MNNKAAKYLVTFFILWVGLMGLAPHLYFSLKTGDISFFQYAFDEPHYYFMSIDPSGIYWMKRSNLTVLFSNIFNGNAALSMMAMDFICPMLVAAAAFFMSGQIFKNIYVRIFSAILLLFGQELLSGGCMSIYGNIFNNFYFGLSEQARAFIPYIGTTFYSIYRTPEPQVGYILMFLYLGYLLRVVLLKDGKPSKLDWFINIVGNVLLGFNYIFCALPVGIFEAGLCASFLLRKRLVTFFYFVVGGLSLGISLFYVYFLAGKDLGSSYGGFVFHSRLPSLTPSQFFAFLAVLLVVWLFWKKVMRIEIFYICASSLLIPFALMNQQIITGVMVSARDWEKYAIYPFLCLVLLLCIKPLSLLLERKLTLSFPLLRLTRLLVLAAALLSFGLVMFLSNGQRKTYQLWTWYNEMSYAYTSAIRQAVAENPSATLCLENVMIEPLINMRFSRKMPFIIYFDDTSFHYIKKLSPGTTTLPEGHEYFKKNLFEYFARRGFTPRDVLDFFQTEVKNRAGFYLGFLFSPMDYTFVATDFRFYQGDEIAKLLPLVADEYNEYLKSFKQSVPGPAFLLTTESADKVKKPFGLWHELVPQKSPVPFFNINIYKQKKPGTPAPVQEK